jgi:hypothetical protein
VPYKLESGLWLATTPAGAYKALSQQQPDMAARFLRAILRQSLTPQLNEQTLTRLSGLPLADALALLAYVQQTGWVEGFPEPRREPQGAFDGLLPPMLSELSSLRRALLADPQGFYVATTGFPHEAAEELAALSAAVGILHERNVGLLQGNLRLGTSAWAVVDAAGNSRIGFWPLHVDTHRFVLTLSGMPILNHPCMVKLAWTLFRHYGASAPDGKMADHA